MSAGSRSTSRARKVENDEEIKNNINDAEPGGGPSSGSVGFFQSSGENTSGPELIKALFRAQERTRGNADNRYAKQYSGKNPFHIEPFSPLVGSISHLSCYCGRAGNSTLLMIV
jgi:hypothetical protein